VKRGTHSNDRLFSQVTDLAEICHRVVASEMQDFRAGEVPMMNPVMNPMNAVTHELADLATRARAEFREMPGMCLTTAQAARLWQLSPARAEELLSELVQAGFLVRRDGQRYRLPSSV
jgi:hypothetical protein